MFESALFESTHALPQRSRWTNATAFVTPVVALLAFVVAGLLHPALLPVLTESQALFVPPPPRPLPLVHPSMSQASASPAAASLPTIAQAPRVISESRFRSSTTAAEGPAVLLTGGMASTMGSGSPLLGLGSGIGSSPVVVRPATPEAQAKGPLHISSGVSAGLLLTPIQPVYPVIARSAHIGGVVTIRAVISTDGHVLQASAISGPEMLRGAALTAVTAARYRPFLLNGQPTAVDTTFTINFRIE